jgi:hypothetical protein
MLLVSNTTLIATLNDLKDCLKFWTLPFNEVQKVLVVVCTPIYTLKYLASWHESCHVSFSNVSLKDNLRRASPRRVLPGGVLKSLQRRMGSKAA